ncbi:MAG: hypothetical protein ACXAC6_03640 [Candidatus Hodarchaeales archaeon]|jgi:hypothetical protein
MASKQFYQPLADLYSRTQQNNISKLFGGVIMSLLLIFAIILVSIGLEVIFGESTYWKTFFNDIRGFGIIAGVILALEVWGLIPRPIDDTPEE